MQKFAWIAVAFVCALASPAAAQPAIEPPRLLSEPDVTYPPGVEGPADVDVLVVIVVAADGSVQSAAAENAEEPFASAAVAAVREWTFAPARRGEQAVAARIRVVVGFRRVVAAAAAPGAPERETPGTGTGTGTGGSGGTGAGPKTEEVRVRGAREPSRTVTLTRTEVRQIPGAFGDPFRAVEIMPGVTPIVSGLPFFFVRGAPPGNVGYYVDGVRVPLLFHVGAGPSVIHPGLIQRVDLYPGGYPARFGRFSGGIVSGEVAAPLDRTHGEANVRLFDVGALAETRFGPQNRGSVLLGGRYSYTAFLLTALGNDTLLDYWDYQMRATYDVGKDDQVGVFAFGSYDYLGERAPGQNLTLFGTEFHRVDLRWDHKLGDKGMVRVGVTTGFDRSRASENRFVRDRMTGARSEWTYYAHPRVLLRAGTDLQLDAYDVEVVQGTLSPSVARITNLFPSRSDLAMGARADAVFGVTRGLEVTPGARVDLYSSQGQTAVGVDPRLAVKTALTERVRVLSALGIAHQPPSFVVPVPGFQPGGLVGGLQKAYQESVGLEVDVAEGTTASATVYHNAFADMSDPLGVSEPQASGCAPGLFPTDTLGGDRTRSTSSFTPRCGVPRFVPGTVGPDRTGGGQQGADSSGSNDAANAFEVRTKGRAYGLEVFLKRKLTSRLGGFLSYTLSRSTRTYEGREYIATFDRTHVLNVALAFDLGRNWRAGGRCTFYTGLPKAPDPTTDDTRLPSFYRFDARLEKRWQLGPRMWLSFVAEWMNVTLHKEAVSTTCTLAGCQAREIGPVTIPSLGLEGGF